MRSIVFLLFIACCFQACTSKNVTLKNVTFEEPAVDKRVELISIVFRLAERPEYSAQEFTYYSDRIDDYFSKYRNHALIEFTKSLIAENGIAFDGPMWLAMHLDDNLNLLPGVKEVWQQNPHWTKDNVEKFVSLLQQFHADTQFDQFFKENTDLYTEAVYRFTPLWNQVDLDWFSSFYGKQPTEAFSVKLGLGGWGNCYGVNLDYANGNRVVYAIMGLWMIDNNGMPEFSVFPDLGILIHEFSHPFVDHLTEKNRDAFRDSGEYIYASLAQVTNEEAYSSWEELMDEALINAAVVKYMRDHHFEQTDIDNWVNLIKYGFGFSWVEALADELENYDLQRDKYSTLESYMPKLAESYKVWVKNMQTETPNE